MSIEGTKEQLSLLLNAAVEAAIESRRELLDMRGIALYDEAKDFFVISLEPFGAVEAGVRDLSLVRERYGIDQSRRITLQLVYEYFARAQSLQMESTVIDEMWPDFLAELDSPVWLTRSVTNLRYFDCEDPHIELGDGVSIRGHNSGALSDLGFNPIIREKLAADWRGFGASSFVLVAETSIPKQPANFITEDTSGTWLSCARAIGAMRLIASGDVGIGTIYLQRVARFNVGIGGIASIGSRVDVSGSNYLWRHDLLQLYVRTYTALAHLEKNGYNNARGNLDLALRAFMSTFDRFPAAQDTMLVDAITALEAVLGSDTEIAFRLSFRVASLLAATDEQRSTMLKTVKSFYDARSKIVHGAHLKPKHRASLAAVDELRDILRKLLRTFVIIAADEAREIDKDFLNDDLDALLINSGRRENLRAQLELA